MNKAKPGQSRGQARKRFRSTHSAERNHDHEDQAVEDARAAREAMLLWHGCLRLLIHLLRSNVNLAAMTTASKKIMGTVASYWLGQERDLEPLGLTPKDILCQGNQ